MGILEEMNFHGKKLKNKTYTKEKNYKTAYDLGYNKWGEVMSDEEIKKGLIKRVDELKEKDMTGSRMFRMIVATLKNDYNYDCKIN